MHRMKIFSDTKLPLHNLELLRNSVSPHEIILPEKPVTSVLAKAEPDPAFAEADVAFGQPDVGSILESNKLRWVHLSTAGFTRYDTPEFRAEVAKRNIVVTNSSSVYAQACAEHALAFMLAQSRQIPQGLRSRVPNGTPEWNKIRQNSAILAEQEVLILGYGGIATRLVALLKPFEVNVTAMRRKPRGDEGVPVVTEEGLPEAFAKADHIINILPDNAGSLDFFNAARFAQCKEGAVFYNIGRGTTVDQSALYEALKSQHLAAAWLDVTDPEPLPDDHPLWTLDNCFITPHTAGGHRDESGTLVRHFLRNFQRYLKGEELADRVM